MVGETAWHTLYKAGGGGDGGSCQPNKPYTCIRPSDGLSGKIFNVTQLGVFRMEKFIGPTVYKWNIQCTAPLGTATASPEWMFRFNC
jgi:hypothetical protein